MKLLSDFDGVWTHPGEEARVQGGMLDELLVAGIAAPRRAEVAAWIATARVAAIAAPREYGWALGGRISCFGDEDPFTAHGALLHYIERNAGRDPVAGELIAAALAAGHDSLEALGGLAHARAVAEVEHTRGPGVLADAASAGRAMLAGGIEIVVVSNSGDEKLTRWFGHVGLPYTLHPAHAPGALRLRGDSRKFALEDSASEPLVVGALRIETRRPYYDRILREEVPGAVVGDVFSLDLALPLALRRGDPAWRNVRLFWLANDYAPPGLRQEIAAGAPEIEILEEGLPGVARRLLGG